MGTIADLLGAGLPDDWQEAVEAAAQPDPAEEETRTSDAIVIEVVLDETGFPPDQMRPDLRLAEDLDLTGLALWSVVSRVERELKRSFSDSDVESWNTLADFLATAAGS